MKIVSKFVDVFRRLPARGQVIIGASVIGIVTILAVGTFVTWSELHEIESRVEETSRGQTELIGKLAIDAIITEDRPALETLIEGLKTMDSGLVCIKITNQEGMELAAWCGHQRNVKDVDCSQPIEYFGQSFGSIETSWSYDHFAAPLVDAKVRTTVVMLVVVLLLIIVLAVLLQSYLIHPLQYLEQRIRSVGDPSLAPADAPQSFVSRELRSINQTLDDASVVLAEKTQVEAAMLTERARAEDAEAAAQAKMDFLSRMSHEIRTPLGAIMGFGELLESAQLDEEERGFLENLNASGVLLLNVINDILELSKIEAEGIVYESRPMNPESVIKEVVGMTSSLAIKKGIALKVRSTGMDGREVLGDEHRIKQVLINLVGNAIKFTDEGEVNVRVSALGPVAPEGDVPESARFRFEVVDTGIGMTEGQLEKIFAPFSQADSTVTRRFGGTGLGLSVASRMVEGMGGRLQVVSELGKGSEFRFDLTMPFGGTRVEKRVKKLSEVSAFLAGGGSGLRILVAEGERTNRVLYRELFSHLGHELELVNDGRACVKRLEEGIHFDVLIVNADMPFVGGNEIVKRLREGEFGERGEVMKLAVMSGGVLAEEARSGPEGEGLFSEPIDNLAGENFPAGVSGEWEGPVERGLHVLVVEDQPLIRHLMEELLSRQGVRATLAEDGLECMDILATQPDIDAILMDLRMPGKDGMSVAKEIRAGVIPGFAEIPIAFVSAEVPGEPELKKLDIVDFIPKPLDLEKLSDFIKKLRDPGEVGAPA